MKCSVKFTNNFMNLYNFPFLINNELMITLHHEFHNNSGKYIRNFIILNFRRMSNFASKNCYLIVDVALEFSIFGHLIKFIFIKVSDNI